MADFNKAIKTVLTHEGGYANNPKDPGGETKFGISKKQYPNADIKNLTRDDAKAIYYKDYWQGRGVEGIMDQRVATFALDTVIQHGQGPLIIQKAVNRAGGNVKEDNAIGPNTRSAINDLDPDRVLSAGVQERLNYVNQLIAAGKLDPSWRVGIEKRIKSFFLSPAAKLTITGGILVGAALIWFLLRRK